MRNKTIILLFFFSTIVLIFHSCKKDEQATGIDKEMLDMAMETAGFTWYKNSDVLLDRSSGSGHDYPFLRTRYNATAATMLDSTGKIIPGSVFPEGSFIVKELYENSTTLGRYAMLYKKAGDANADANGWVWGYVNADGTVAQSADEKGSGCRGCHSETNNIDYMLMNIYFP